MRGRESDPPLMPLLDIPLCSSSPHPQRDRSVTADCTTCRSTCTCGPGVAGSCTPSSNRANNPHFPHQGPAYLTPTRRLCHPNTSRRACSNPYSSTASSVSVNCSPAQGRDRSSTWSGAPAHQERLHFNSNSNSSGGTTHHIQEGEEEQAQALIRGDVSWICRQRPRISGSITLHLNLNFTRIKRYMMVFLYLSLMVM